MLRGVRRHWLGAAAFLLVLGTWAAASGTGLIRPIFLPSPASVMTAVVTLFTRDAFLRDIAISIGRIAGGFALGGIPAVPLGILIATNRRAESALEPLIDFVRYTPIPAFIPLFILWFGIGETEKVIVIAAAVFFQLVLMVAASVAQVPRALVESALTLGATKGQVLRRVIWRHSLPRIVSDMRINLGWAWASLMMAEMVGSSAGIGYVIIQSQRLLQTSSVMAGIAVIGLLGLCSDLGIKQLSRFLFPWAPHTATHADA